MADDAEPRVVEVGGTTDAVAWVDEADVASGAVPVLDVVTHALSAAGRAEWVGARGRTYDEGMNPRQRRLVIPVALGALLLIVVLASVL